ncbi:MAG: hypothetical protein K6E34_07110 [Lachnospiraceae bacterium]|nr:hypothetical protein [Lachnospiraceae bacterium]
MTGRRLFGTTLIVSMAGIAFGCLISHLTGSWEVEYFLFYPIWFIGIYYFGTPWRRIFGIWAGLETVKTSKRILTGDRYHIPETLIGGCIFAFALTIGWIIGLVKFVYYIIKACMGYT